MARALTREERAVWKDRISRQATSGESVAEFCAREQVSDASFYRWKRNLKVGPCKRSTRTKTARKDSATTPRSTTAGSAFFQLPVAPSRGAAWIELVLADGTVLRLPQQNLAALELALTTIVTRSAN